MKHQCAIFVLAVLVAGMTLAAVQEVVPIAPVGLSSKADHEGALAVANLTWQDESDNEVGFQILRSDNGEEFEVVGFVGANTNKYKDKVGRYVTGSFTYRVRAFNQTGPSADSNASSVWF